MSREAMSKKLRFEVFKRDNFTCQYCGGQAPDVILHVDHINPVAGGGDNDILNLITSCEPCNLGKGARPLDDNSVIAKQRAQLEDLNQRREQLEMMLEWRNGLISIDDQMVDRFDEVFQGRTRQCLNDYGRSEVKKWLKKYQITELLDGLEDALNSYYKNGSEDAGENSSIASKAFHMTPRILANQKANADKPWMKDIFYIRAIARNRLSYFKDDQALVLLKRAYEAGIFLDDMKDLAKTARTWTAWKETMWEWIEDEEAGR